MNRKDDAEQKREDALPEKKLGRPSMLEEEAERVRTVMRLLLDSKKETRTSLGKKLGMKQPSVSNILGNPRFGIPPKNRPSEDTARKVAALLGLPSDFWRTPLVSDQLGENVTVFQFAADPHYPTRAFAVRLAQMAGISSAERIQEVLQISGLPSDPGMDFWVKALTEPSKGSGSTTGPKNRRR